jgi:hypothetical protein
MKHASATGVGCGVRFWSRSRLGLGLTALSSLVGFVLVAVATGGGVGLSADSAYYIGVANELAAGHGLTIPFGTPEPTPLGTQWGPLMPAVLAAVAQFGPDPVHAIRWINALCLAGTAIICAAAIRKATGSSALSVAAALLLVTSQAMLSVHAMAWSEPVFIFLAMLALVLMASHLRTQRKLVLVGAVTAAAAAWLTRYAGASLVVTAFACLLIQPGRWRFRIAAACCVALMAMLPMTPDGPTWIGWMRTHLGGMTVDSHRASALEILRIKEGFGVILNWLWPWGFDAYQPRGAAMQVASGTLVLAALLIVTLYSWAAILRRSGARRAKERASGVPSDAGRADLADSSGAELGAVMGLFIAVYMVFVVAAVSLFGRVVSFNTRIMLPMMPAAVIMLAVGWNVLWRRFGQSRGFGFACAGAVAVVLSVRVAGAVDYCPYVASGHGMGAQGYHHQSWRTSPTITALRGLPETATLYSNAPDAVYLLTGRNALWLTMLAECRGGSGPNENPRGDSSHKADGEFIVFFDRVGGRSSMPTKEDLAIWPLHTVSTTKDGAVYSIAEPLTRRGARDERPRLPVHPSETAEGRLPL